MKTRSTIYIESSEWDEFKEICKREGESMAEKLGDFIRQYNDRHRIGNPQMRLDIGFGVETKRFCYCGEKASYEAVSLDNRKFFLCEVHYVQNRDARLLRRTKKL